MLPFWFRNEVWLKIRDNEADADVTKAAEVTEDVPVATVDVHADDVIAKSKWRHSLKIDDNKP